jgi:CRP/FNR family transcriptional regulator, cyclic AMP receptor protein
MCEKWLNFRGNSAPPPSLCYRLLVASAERIAQLGQVVLFRGLTEEALALIAEIAEEEDHPVAHVIFRQGEIGEKLYVIVSGRVRISRDVGGMGEEALAILGPGSCFGEMALVDDSPRSADAHVHEKCRLLSIPKEAFEELLFLHKDLAYEVLWSTVRILTARLRDTNDKITFLSTTTRF